MSEFPSFPKNTNAVKNTNFNVVLGSAANGLIKPIFYHIDKPPTDTPVGKSYLGTPVYDNLQILGGSYFDNDGNKITYGNVGEVYLTINAVLFNVNQVKNIIRTQITGKDGDVIEYISDGNYNVVINGVLVSPDTRYPSDDVDKLIQVCLAKASIEVVSNFLQRFSIHNLVIMDYDFPQVVGLQNSQQFTLNCISDNPLETQISE